jgi:hypothetical protein
VRSRPWILIALLSTGCLSTLVGTGRNVLASKMVTYTQKCVQVPSPAPAWCDQAYDALTELRAADQAAQGAVGLKGSTREQRKRLNDAIEATQKAFDGR